MRVSNLSREGIERLDRYVKQVSKGNSHISAEYEKKLIRKYRASSGVTKEQILTELISYNITILAEIAIQVLNSMKGGDRIDPLDLMQLGIITFMKKLGTWDETKKAKMITYYYRDVKTQMQRFIMNNAFQVRQGSVFLQHLAYSISKVTQRWLVDYEREPTITEFSVELGIAESTIKYCMQITSIQTLKIEDNWVMYKSTLDDTHYSLPPLYTIASLLINKVIDGKSETVLYELMDFLEKKQALSSNTLQALRGAYIGEQ